jgi:hypothetical protein
MVFPTTACFGPQNNLRLFTCLSTTHTEAIYLLGVGQDNADGSLGGLDSRVAKMSPVPARERRLRA